MIVFDLKCARDHVFEAWFGSSEDYESQHARGLLVCPMCGDAEVTKAVMAPAVPAKGNSRPERAAAPSAGDEAPAVTPEQAREIIAKLAQAQSEMLKNSDWVGSDFADTARAMHYGEVDSRPIHGEVDAGQARGLMEEGVPVAPLPLPYVPPKARN